MTIVLIVPDNEHFPSFKKDMKVKQSKINCCCIFRFSSPTSKMFATATRNFVEEVDKGGVLIPVSSLNDSIKMLSLVIKRRRHWFWQKPKYLATDFCFNDILSGDQPILPGKPYSTMFSFEVVCMSCLLFCI